MVETLIVIGAILVLGGLAASFFGVGVAGYVIKGGFGLIAIGIIIWLVLYLLARVEVDTSNLWALPGLA